jgi:hypothetical protein
MADLATNRPYIIDDMLFNPHFVEWYQQFQQNNILPVNENLTENTESIPFKPLIELTTLAASRFYSNMNTTYMNLDKRTNCSTEDSRIYLEASKSAESILLLLNKINYSIIVMGIIFNIINLYVLLKSKLNESPYSYLTILAMSDLGSLLSVGIEKIRQQFEQTEAVRDSHLIIITILNIFQSCSIYITLALTIERFIFVHSPFKAMTICRKSIARRVCLGIFLFSILRCSYLPFMYNPNCSNGYSQKKNKLVDILEFLVSLGIPYIIIFIANISLIHSLNKQNNLMNIPISFSYNLSINSGSSFNLNQINQQQTYVPQQQQHQKSMQQSIPSPRLNNGKHRYNKKNMNRNNTNNNENKPMLSTQVEEVNENIENEEAFIRKKLAQELIIGKKLARQSTLSLKLIDENTAATIVAQTISTPKRMNLKKLKQNSNTINSFNKSTTSGTSSLGNGSSLYNKANFLYHRTSNQRELRNQRKLTTTLIIILCLLLICYMPSFLFEESLADAIFGTHDRPTEADSIKAYKIKLIGTRVSYIFIYLNCSCNFLIYCFCNKKFKNSLKILIKKSYTYKLYIRFLTFISKSCVSFYKKNKSEIKQHHHDIELKTIVIDNQNVNITSVNKTKIYLLKDALFKKNKNIIKDTEDLTIEKLV